MKCRSCGASVGEKETSCPYCGSETTSYLGADMPRAYGRFSDVSYDVERELAKELERSKMTQSLRYNILRRDGFRCRICGASALEGAKLEVDHIVPIAKGGKTEPENLRTLCDRCNGGKSDKYDPFGIN